MHIPRNARFLSVFCEVRRMQQKRKADLFSMLIIRGHFWILYKYKCVCVYTSIHIFIYIFIYLLIYIFIHLHMHILHIFTYVFIYIFLYFLFFTSHNRSSVRQICDCVWDRAGHLYMFVEYFCHAYVHMNHLRVLIKYRF